MELMNMPHEHEDTRVAYECILNDLLQHSMHYKLLLLFAIVALLK